MAKRKKSKVGAKPTPIHTLSDIFSALRVKLRDFEGDKGKADARNISSIKIDFTLDPNKTIMDNLDISVRHNKSVDLELNLTSARQ